MPNCEVCGLEFEKLEDQYVEGLGRIKFCEACHDIFLNTYPICSYCGRHFLKNVLDQRKYKNLCYSCFDSKYVFCEDCGLILERDVSMYFKDSTYCEVCFYKLMELYSKKELTEILLEIEVSRPFPTYFLENWLEQLKKDLCWTDCPCSLLGNKGACGLTGKKKTDMCCNTCERSDLFVEIIHNMSVSEEDEIKEMFIKCVENLIYRGKIGSDI